MELLETGRPVFCAAVAQKGDWDGLADLALSDFDLPILETGHPFAAMRPRQRAGKMSGRRVRLGFGMPASRSARRARATASAPGSV